MVRYNQLYHGSTHIGYISKNGQIVKKVYKGSELIYQLGFDPVTFNVSSSLQTFTVPLGVSKIHVDCVASKGADTQEGYFWKHVGGKGGRVQCDLSVNGGETLYVMVGAEMASGATASYNASDIRLGGNTIADRIIVAGGGGNAGNLNASYNADGGNGGGTTGESGDSSGYAGAGGTGGTQTAGGTGSATGTQSLGGSGGASAGGAGYWGGGSGRTGSDGTAFYASGGGGGSSYTNSNCSNVVHTQGYNDGAGYITISFVS